MDTARFLAPASVFQNGYEPKQLIRSNDQHFFSSKLADWCTPGPQLFAVLDLDRDGRADLVCGETSNTTANPYRVDFVAGRTYPNLIDQSSKVTSIEIMATDLINLDGTDPQVPCSGSRVII